MKLIIHTQDTSIEKIINDLNLGRSSRPDDFEDEITGYWKHHLSQIKIEKIGDSTICLSGESGFYFPGMTYSGSDLINTLYKRFGLMRSIKNSQYDLSIPQSGSNRFGYKIAGKYISSDFLRSIHHAEDIITGSKNNGISLPPSLKILEIGSGTGIQALVFKLLYKKSTYYLVDFPETLALAEVFLRLVLPESKMLFYSDWKENPKLLEDETYDFIFVPNYEISKVPSHSIHMSLNTVSMQEMNYKTISMYFNELRRILVEPALFYQCNRDKAMDGTLIEVEKYPYTDRDQHLFSKIDSFYKKSIFLRKCFGRFPILRYIRIPIIKKGAQIAMLTRMSSLVSSSKNDTI